MLYSKMSGYFVTTLFRVRIDGWQYFKPGHFLRAFAYAHGQGRAMSIPSRSELHGRNAMAGTYDTIAERGRAANYARTAAIASVSGFTLGEGLLSQIEAEATDDFNNASPWTRRSDSDRISIAAGIAQQYVNTAAAKPLNASSATPAEIAAQQQALRLSQGGGLQGLTRLANSDGTASGGERSTSSAAYGRELLAGAATGSPELNAAYKSLLGEGYSKQRLDAVMPYAQSLGWRDKEGLGALADAGTEYSAMTAELEKARKRNDTAAVERIEQQRREYREQRKGKETKREKRGRDIIDQRVGRNAAAVVSELGDEAALNHLAEAGRRVRAGLEKPLAKDGEDKSGETDAWMAAMGDSPSTPQAPVKKQLAENAHGTPQGVAEKPKAGGETAKPKDGNEPERPKETKVGVATQVKQSAPSMTG